MKAVAELTSPIIELDCLVIGDGCIGLYIAQTLKQAQPQMRIGIKARTSTQLEPHKRWIKQLCENKNIVYLQSFTDLNPVIEGLIVTTKSDDVAAVAKEVQQAHLQIQHHLKIYNGILPALKPDFPGSGARAVPPAGYALDKSSDNGLQLVNADKAWPIFAEADSQHYWVDFLQAGGQAAFADETLGLGILRKFLINTAVNPLTAIYQRKVDELLDDAMTYQRMKNILRETITVLRSCDEHVSALAQQPDDKALLAESFAFIETYRGHYTSAYHAFMAGKAIEISSLTHYAIQRGKSLGIATPYNDAVANDINNIIIQRDKHSQTKK